MALALGKKPIVFFFSPTTAHEIPLGKSKRLLFNVYMELNAIITIHQNKSLCK